MQTIILWSARSKRLSRCHGIAIAKDLGKDFISDGGGPSAKVQQVVFFDLEFPAVDGKGMIYDNSPEKNDVVAIDGSYEYDQSALTDGTAALAKFSTSWIRGFRAL